MQGQVFVKVVIAKDGHFILHVWPDKETFK